MKVPVKCSTSGCHQRKKVFPEELQMLRSESEKAGQQAA